jgi:hemophore-related protein
MIELSATGLTVAVAGAALSLSIAAGVASADPDLGPIVYTSCNYAQVMAALNAQDPGAAAQINSSPMAQTYLHQFLLSPPSRRMAMAQQLAGSPEAQQNFGLVEQVAATCKNY